MIVSLVFAVAACGPPPATLSAAGEHAASADAAPEQRALAFLTREVPQWHREHACFSCHNNGDAARALYRLRTLGHRLPDEVLADTTAWLARPEGWKDNHGDERFSDKTLANIQFAAALAAAQEARAIDDRQALVRAAELLVRDQQNDGTWHVDAGGAIGSPITWGRFLSAALCRDVLVRAGRRRFAGPIDRIDGFLRREAPRTVLDAAGGLLGLAEADDAAAIRQRQT
ncbi:MAG TPA: hypothetical protein VML55_06530, partial [Planctomycetaceae bacterium]|nr:hypothetical protein [Planctomycetaceae bacterium]